MAHAKSKLIIVRMISISPKTRQADHTSGFYMQAVGQSGKKIKSFQAGELGIRRKISGSNSFASGQKRATAREFIYSDPCMPLHRLIISHEKCCETRTPGGGFVRSPPDHTRIGTDNALRASSNVDSCTCPVASTFMCFVCMDLPSMRSLNQSAKNVAGLGPRAAEAAPPSP